MTDTPQPAQPFPCFGVPDAPAAFRELPSGAVMPEGRWKDALERIAEGWLRRVVEARHGQYYSTFWERNTFGEFPGDVHAEWAGYTADAIIRLSHLLPDSFIAREKAPWLARVLASQDPDGYLGAYRPAERWRHGFELWSQDRLLQALLCEYEHSGDPQILEACARAARRIVAQFESPEWSRLYARPRGSAAPHQVGHSLNIVHPFLRLAELTGDPVFRDLALAIYADYDAASGDFSAARFLAAEKIFLHIVTVCEHLSIPATLHAAGGPRRWLEASLRAFDLLCTQSLQVTGILSGNEATYGLGPRKLTEHCGVIEWMISCSRLLALTGQVRFADLAERAMLNAYFATRAADGATLAYNHAPNQLVAANWSAPYEDNWDRAQFRAHYSSHHEPRCCNANTSRGLPNYVQRAAMLAPEGGLALVYYGPCRVAARLPGVGEVRLRVQTDYPYEDEVRITVESTPGAPFPLLLRIPGWRRSAAVRVNGQPTPEPAAGSFHRIERDWRPGDRIELAFDFPIELHQYTASWHSVPGVAVTRGPLTFTLPIPEQWEGVAPEAPGGLDEDWNVLPAADAQWNVALDLDLQNPESSLRLERLAPDSDNPQSAIRNPQSAIRNPHSDNPQSAIRNPQFIAPPVALRVRARLLPDWRADSINGRPQTPALPPPPLRPSGPVVEATLVPFAFTHIRMTYLPVLGHEQTRQVLYDQGKAVGG